MTIDNSIGPWKMEEPPFKINGIFLNNVKQDSDIIRSRAVTILGKSTYSANLSIAEVVKYDRSLEGGVQNPKAPRYRTPAGLYEISFYVSLTSMPPSKIKISEALEIPDVIVRYGVD